MSIDATGVSRYKVRTFFFCYRALLLPTALKSDELTNSMLSLMSQATMKTPTIPDRIMPIPPANILRVRSSSARSKDTLPKEMDPPIRALGVLCSGFTRQTLVQGNTLGRLEQKEETLPTFLEDKALAGETKTNAGAIFSELIELISHLLFEQPESGTKRNLFRVR